MVDYMQKEYLRLHLLYKDMYKNTPWYYFKKKKELKNKAFYYKKLMIRIHLE